MTATWRRCASTTGRSTSSSSAPKDSTSGRSRLCQLRFPKLMNVRSDPFEDADIHSELYPEWRMRHAYALVPAQAFVAQFLATFQEFPPRQAPASFSIDEVHGEPDRCQRGVGRGWANGDRGIAPLHHRHLRWGAWWGVGLPSGDRLDREHPSSPALLPPKPPSTGGGSLPMRGEKGVLTSSVSSGTASRAMTRNQNSLPTHGERAG